MKNIKITNQFLDDISKKKSIDERGLTFELFVQKLYAGLGYKTFKASDIKTTNFDVSCDLVIENNAGVRRGVQCKYKSKGTGAVGYNAYDGVMAAKDTYDYTECEIITNSNVSKDGFSSFVIEQAQAHNRKVSGKGTLVLTGGSGLRKLIKKYQELNPNEK